MNKALLFINTVKHLKAEQILFRLKRHLIKPTITDDTYAQLPYRAKEWIHANLHNEKINDQLDACFLNDTKKIDLSNDWNNKSLSKLWAYNLHYFEDLLSDSAHKKHDLHLHMINSWINNNPIGYGNGWEPYTISLRIVNILKAWLGGLELDEKQFKSIFDQASFLSNDLEKHLLANHYFANLKALLFTGIVFNKVSWIDHAEQCLSIQITEQILEDGAHCELSPMYHSLILVDMLDMVNLIRAYPNKVSDNFSILLNKNIPKMISFMEAMAHPDGGVSFFNDSVNGIAPAKNKTESYAKMLGYLTNSCNIKKFEVIDNANSGYICAKAGNTKLIFDACPVGYSYNPGHAHADTLSFELSIAQQRVFVNSGVYEYELSNRRLLQRKTLSHNTVEINDKDSSQVWGAFRVANRAEIINRSILQTNSSIHLSAMHNGYKDFLSGCYIQRNIDYSDNFLIINDSIEGVYKKAISRLHFHPDILITIKNRILTASSSDFIMTCNLKNKHFSLDESEYSPEFGIILKNQVLQTEIISGEQNLRFDWEFM